MTAALATSSNPHLQRLLWLFDNLSLFPHSYTTLFETTTPGAAEALRIWAAELGLDTDERGSDVGGGYRCVAVTTANYARIAVHVPATEGISK